jgi:chromosome segregation ATPase
MDSSISYNDDEHIESVASPNRSVTDFAVADLQKRLTQSQCLELAYQDALRSADLIIKDESARRLRLRILLLENENDNLHEQLGLSDDRIDGLEQEGEELRAQLESTQEALHQQQNELWAQTRELSNVKVPALSSCRWLFLLTICRRS